jgi:hypothetical protein
MEASVFLKDFFINLLMHKWIVFWTVQRTHTNKDPLICAATSPHTDVFYSYKAVNWKE